jgi:hypothetical protein
MAVTKKTPGYQIDGRVSIALDALDDKQKQAIGGVITDRAHFLASTADSKRVRRISEEHSLYILKVPLGLRIIFSKVGDDIVVMDLMRQTTLDRFGRKTSKSRTGRTKKVRPVSHSKKAK